MSKDNGGPAFGEFQQARRAAFESQMEALNKSPGEWRGNHYSNPYGNSSWLGFNAALDCVVIELPADCKLSRDGLDECYFAGQMRDDILHAIESTNLGIKVK